jgi:hypothetical protein
VGEPEYVAARRVLLDALDALGAHRDALVLVGAQAIYLHTGEGDLAVAPYTTDGDLALDPARLSSEPTLEDAMRLAGFRLDEQPGIWRGAGEVEIDLLVPEAVGGGGTRGARLDVHGNRAARKARGLEAALVDNSPSQITAFEPDDDRLFALAVAGPAALLVAKLHKLADRRDAPSRLDDKDALDVVRLLRATRTQEVAEVLQRLTQDAQAAEVTSEAIEQLDALFASPDAHGCQMAARAVTPLEDPATIAVSAAALASDLIRALSA